MQGISDQPGGWILTGHIAHNSNLCVQAAVSLPGHMAQVAGPGLDHDRHGSEAPQLALHWPTIDRLPAQAGMQRSLIDEPLQTDSSGLEQGSQPRTVQDTHRLSAVPWKQAPGLPSPSSTLLCKRPVYARVLYPEPDLAAGFWLDLSMIRIHCWSILASRADANCAEPHLQGLKLIDDPMDALCEEEVEAFYVRPDQLLKGRGHSISLGQGLVHAPNCCPAQPAWRVFTRFSALYSFSTQQIAG